MKVYTRGGDAGETALFGGRRVRKDALRVEAYGAIDELNALLGLTRVEIGDEDLDRFLDGVQHRLFDLGSELATPDVDEREQKGKGIARVCDDDVADVEAFIDTLEEELEPLRSFILPGGTRGAALLQLARTVCRRGERRLVTLTRAEPISPILIRYANRLSDLLFVMARVVNRRAGVPEPIWKGGRK